MGGKGMNRKEKRTQWMILCLFKPKPFGLTRIISLKPLLWLKNVLDYRSKLTSGYVLLFPEQVLIVLQPLIFHASDKFKG